MAAAELTARGGDGTGIIRHPGVILGHTRLAINDPGPNGAQPFVSKDGRLSVVVNGEIYNATDLRGNISWPHTPEGRSDCLAVFDAWAGSGDEFPSLLRGMFALAVYDHSSATLHLARDRAGERPLFFYHGDGFTAFASSLAALLPLVDTPHLSRRGLAQYLLHGAAAAPHTLIRGLSALPAGHQMRLSAHHTTFKSYWRPEFAAARQSGTWNQHFDRAVAEASSAEVPIGLFLSGGLDSLLILESWTRQKGRGVATFTIGTGETDSDESNQAAEAARFFGARHHEIPPCQLTDDRLSAIVHGLGEPIGDGSLILVRHLAEAERHEVKAALTGDGGDELFLGYERYAAVTAASRPVARHLVRFLLPIFGGRRRLKLARLCGGGAASPAEQFLWTQFLGSLEVWRDGRGLGLTAEYQAEVDRYRAIWDSLQDFAIPQKLALLDRETCLATTLNAKTDRAAGGIALETRSPFLDHQLVEYMVTRMRLDPRFPGFNKELQRRYLKGRVPREWLRRRKRGFGAPVARWLANPDLSARVWDDLESPEFSRRGVVPDLMIPRLKQDVVAQVPLAAELALALCILERWLQKYAPAATLESL